MREKTVPTFIAAGLVALTAIFALGASGETQMPVVYLNHVYRVLDPETFREAEASDYLRTTFAAFERRTTKSGDDTWTGLYFYGENTYFEFLAADPRRDRPVGQSGFAFGIEEEGGSKAVRKALDGLDLGLGPAKTIDRTRETAGKMVPWFHMTGFEAAPGDPVLVAWVMEYSTAFLKKWHPELRPELAGISRKAVLERYAAKAALTIPPKDPLFRNVTGVRLALDAAHAESFGRELSALGFRKESASSGASWMGPGVRIDVVPAEGEAKGIVAIEMALTRKPEEAKSLELAKGARLEIRTDGTGSFLFF
jgi:hypothetical protein